MRLSFEWDPGAGRWMTGPESARLGVRPFRLPRVTDRPWPPYRPRTPTIGPTIKTPLRTWSCPTGWGGGLVEWRDARHVLQMSAAIGLLVRRDGRGCTGEHRGVCGAGALVEADLRND
ncbi:hypothetical protein GCM10009730_58350 [Streptomyces albidochromogenes]